MHADYILQIKPKYLTCSILEKEVKKYITYLKFALLIHVLEQE